MSDNKKPQKEMAYYLTMFRLKGHTTWRCHLGQSPDSLERHFECERKQGVIPPVVTEKNILRVDRITGQLRPL